MTHFQTGPGGWLPGALREREGTAMSSSSTSINSASLKARGRTAISGRQWAIEAGTEMGINSNSEWTDYDDRRLLELKAEGKSFREIASTLMRSAPALEQRIYILRHRRKCG